jgi:hypothetical protein
MPWPREYQLVTGARTIHIGLADGLLKHHDKVEQCGSRLPLQPTRNQDNSLPNASLNSMIIPLAMQVM